jgi:Family of unknown function (DUF6152)
VRKLWLIVTASVGLFATVDAYSHHSFSAEFDVGKPVNLVGVVKEFEWTNPHAWLHLEVTDAQGKTQEWAVEFLGVNALVRSGMSPKTVKPGDKLTVSGYGARNGTNTANASSLNRTDTGESLWASVRPGSN